MKTTLTQPHMPEEFRTNGVHIAFIGPLVNVLSGAVTDAARTSLSGDGRITSHIKIDTFNLTVRLTSALISTLTDVVRENERDIRPATQVIGEVAELRSRMKSILVDALNDNPFSPTLNNDSLRKFLKDALIPTSHTNKENNNRVRRCGRQGNEEMEMKVIQNDEDAGNEQGDDVLQN